MVPEDVLQLAERVLDLARARGVRIATAESCTGGLVAGALTAIAGSSDVVEGGLEVAGVGAVVAVTGIAGPGGGSDSKPVGLVHFAVARKGGPTVHREMRFGDIGRQEVRAASVKVALQMLLERLGG